MNKLTGTHPTLEALAAFADGQSPEVSEIEAHIDTCEHCALNVLAGREALAVESLNAEGYRMTPSFESRARRKLSALMGTSGSHNRSDGLFGMLGLAGMVGGIGGVGSFPTGSDFVLAEFDNRDLPASSPEKSSAESETSGSDTPSNPGDDDVARMLDHISNVLGDGWPNDHADAYNADPSDDDSPTHMDATTWHETDVPPSDHGDGFDHGSPDTSGHHNHHDKDDDDDFPG